MPKKNPKKIYLFRNTFRGWLEKKNVYHTICYLLWSNSWMDAVEKRNLFNFYWKCCLMFMAENVVFSKDGIDQFNKKIWNSSTWVGGWVARIKNVMTTTDARTCKSRSLSELLKVFLAEHAILFSFREPPLNFPKCLDDYPVFRRQFLSVKILFPVIFKISKFCCF